ncbi:hypothetical protein [Streptomyces sp. A1-5]|uniref:hypothetical protein n=1 Tax=Streptomyces sp. A1-5 TaxID=2738410 RepID=UPI001F34FB48|nr:hypothetical protein [Streptomyces sp. A1-5]UJB45730.1 hypothetical protein HRD51_37580 [Streptomyces sp. A1-5]
MPENEVPAGRGRPGPVLPPWLLESVAKSAEGAVWLSAKFKKADEAAELRKLLQYVNRSNRHAYHVETRREATAEGHRVLFKAEHDKAFKAKLTKGESNG